LELFPAIDLRGGRCVRLVEGDFSRETVYSDDPLVVATGFAEAGVRWVHVVDLDAARTGEPVNRQIVTSLAGRLAGSGVKVQTGGGVRSFEDAASLLDTGVERVVIGTAAVADPGLVSRVAERWPGRVVVGLDHRGGEVQLKGWLESARRTVSELVPIAIQAGASAVIVTDISRDGRLVGPDVDGLAALVAETRAPVIASGGVGSIDDLHQLAGVSGLEGVIVGKAIYEGRIDVASALAVVAAG
jgi:phosphoribosylformimino-5-aminoimidazole carboxamide ribotide isomerase